jgi:O-glycosyl hydrolase
MLAPLRLFPYITTSSKDVEKGAAITVANNSFEYTLPAKSVVTFVEQ